MSGTDRHGDEGDLARVARGVALIVMVGVALGVAYNAFGLASRPPRGLAWVKRAETLPSLESMPPVVVRTDSAAAVTAPDGSSPPPAHGAPAAAGTGRAEGAGTPPPPNAAPAPRTAASRLPAGLDLPVVPESDQPVKVGLAMFKRFHDAGAALVVDAREVPEYAAGHIPGAVNLPYNDALAEPERIQRLGEGSRPIVVYCSAVTCDLASSLAKWLIENGKRRVLVYEGGFSEWSVAGHPTETGAGR